MTLKAVNLAEAFGKFDAHWQPKIVATYNDNEILVVKIKGEFVWHSHPETDDLFFVMKGQIVMQMRKENVVVREGELFVVPKGVEHCPMASDEAHILLIEPKGTPNTGDHATAVKKEKLLIS